MFLVTWNQHERQLRAVDEVDALLDDLDQDFSTTSPVIVTVQRVDTCDSLSIGLGRSASVLNFVRGDGSPPYLISVGPTEGDEPVSFLFEGDWSEFAMRNTIPLSHARSALSHFCSTGELSPAVVWEEV